MKNTRLTRTKRRESLLYWGSKIHPQMPFTYEVHDLARRYGVSENTMWGDLRALEAEGLVSARQLTKEGHLRGRTLQSHGVEMTDEQYLFDLPQQNNGPNGLWLPRKWQEELGFEVVLHEGEPLRWQP